MKLNKELDNLCKEYAMGKVFTSRPCNDEDWERVMEFDWDDDRDYLNDFKLCEEVYGYSPSYTHDKVVDEYESYQMFVEQVLVITDRSKYVL
jgi:hypothetical protein